MKLEFLIINVLIFISAFLLGIILEKRRCQKKVNKIYGDVFKGEK